MKNEMLNIKTPPPEEGGIIKDKIFKAYKDEYCPNGIPDINEVRFYRKYYYDIEQVRDVFAMVDKLDDLIKIKNVYDDLVKQLYTIKNQVAEKEWHEEGGDEKDNNKEYTYGDCEEKVLEFIVDKKYMDKEKERLFSINQKDNNSMVRGQYRPFNDDSDGADYWSINKTEDQEKKITTLCVLDILGHGETNRFKRAWAAKSYELAQREPNYQDAIRKLDDFLYGKEGCKSFESSRVEIIEDDKGANMKIDLMCAPPLMIYNSELNKIYYRSASLKSKTYKNTKHIEELKINSELICGAGFMQYKDEPVLNSTERKLEPNEEVFLLSDGIVESLNKDKKDIILVLDEFLKSGRQDLYEYLLELVNKYPEHGRGEGDKSGKYRRDDTTILSFRLDQGS